MEQLLLFKDEKQNKARYEAMSRLPVFSSRYRDYWSIVGRGRKMTKYEYLINKADECETKALKEKKPDMLLFWKHASEGFKQKALNLTVEEGIKPHD